MITKSCVLFVSLALSFPSQALSNRTDVGESKNSHSRDLSSLTKIVNLSIDKFEKTKKSHWSFIVSRYENEEGDITSSIEGYTPNLSREKQWELIQINNNPPTDKQKQTFRREKLKQINANQSDENFSIKLSELIEKNSLEFTTENNLHIQMSFNVQLTKLGEDSVKKLKGSLLFNKELEFIEKITIVNTEEFSPMFSASISDFKLTFTFINIDNNILPEQHDMEMKGTFAFFTEINEVSTDTFSNYINLMIK